MPDTAPAKMTNGQLHEATAELMGWQVATCGRFWERTGKGVTYLSHTINDWSPTTDPADAARLLRFLVKSGCCTAIHMGIGRFPEYGDGLLVVARIVPKDSDRYIGEVLSYTADPTGGRCLCMAAVEAYRARQEAGG